MYQGLYAPVPDTDAYLKRLEMPTITDNDPDTLNRLIYAHQCRIPFENLDIWESRSDISLNINDIFEKVITSHRGGYCFELNELFTQFLMDLGYHAWPCMCRILRGRDSLFPILHRGILVDIHSQLYFCDVGYGGPSAPFAVPVTDGNKTQMLGETFYIKKKDDYWWLLIRDTSQNTQEKILEFYTMPQENVDFVPINEYCSKSRDSIFPHKLLVNLRTSQGSMSITDNAFTITENGQSKTRLIENRAELNQLLKEYFGIDYSLTKFPHS